MVRFADTCAHRAVPRANAGPRGETGELLTIGKAYSGLTDAEIADAAAARQARKRDTMLEREGVTR